MTEKSFKTVKTLAQKYPEHSESSIRYFLFHRDSNGLAEHVRKLGRKILICEQGWLSWIDSNGGQA